MYCTVQDVTDLFRPLTPQETERTIKLIEVIEDTLKQEAKRRNKI